MTIVKTSLKSIKEYLTEEYGDIYSVQYDDGFDIIYNGESLFGLNNDLPLTESKAWNLAFDILETKDDHDLESVKINQLQSDNYNKSPKKFKYKNNEY